MSKVQVVYASRHGATAGIAERIAEVFRGEGIGVQLDDAADRPELRDVDGYVIGSGIYLGSWLKDGVRFLEGHLSALASRPVWLFSSGPLPGSSKNTDETDPLSTALGPEDGPGSGGHRKIAALSAVVHPREHRVFPGAYNPADPPKSMPERVLRLLPASKSILPSGDWRDWDAIEAWARTIAAELREAPVPVA
jgi:menaquinone-dependent protoporphyrinogen oxidase